MIIGCARNITGLQRLFLYSWESGITEEINVQVGINGYLLDGPIFYVNKCTKVLSPILPYVFAGSMPNDGGNLIVEPEDYDEVMSDPIAAKYVRSFRMGKELIRGLDRWCLWLEGVSKEEITNSPIISSRTQAVWEIRSASSRVATRKLADIPHLFGENHQPLTQYVAIPVVVSENRPYYTASLLPQSTIAGNKLYTVVDPQGFLFSIISSSMFIAWQRTVGGRMKSDLSFSNTIVWNNLPLPPVSEDLRARIIAAGKKILAAREAIEERAGERVGLDKMYASLDDMDPALRKAHEELDLVVDVAFGASRPCTSNDQRISILIGRYLELTGAAPSTPPVNESPASTPPLAA